MTNKSQNDNENERQNRIKEYEDEQSATADYLSKALLSGKVLKSSGYQIFDVHQANSDFRKVLKLDSINEIAGVYKTIEKNDGPKITNEHIVKIKKQNFYNAFYRPIWENLTLAEKVKSLEWMFETINEQKNLQVPGIKYFTDDISVADDMGYFDPEDNYLFLNLNDLDKKSSYIMLPVTLAHELMHARQEKYAKTINSNKKYDFYTISQTSLNLDNFDEISLEYGLDDATGFALYRTTLSEKTAALQALKTLKKYIELNSKQFGKDKRTNSQFNAYVNETLFEEVDKKNNNSKVHLEPIFGIVTNEKVILKGQSEFLSKLLFLKTYYESHLSLATKELLKLEDLHEKGKICEENYKERQNKLFDDSEYCQNKLKIIKRVFKRTLKTGVKPYNFDEEKEFEPLNIKKESESKYSLPKWLHKYEDEFNKKLCKWWMIIKKQNM